MTRSAIRSSGVGSRLTIASLRAVVLRQFGKPGRRIDDQRGAEDDEQIGRQRLLLGAPHRDGRHRLAERHRRGFDMPKATLARRHRAVALEGRAQIGDLVPLAAIETGRVGGVAVQLDDFLGRHAGGLVQPVDILRDDGAGLAAPHQRIDRAVAAIGLRAAEVILHREAAPPGLAPRLLGRQELVEIDRRHLRPDAAGAAEIGDAGLGADAGAGEHDRAARLVDQAGERGNLAVGSHGASLANPAPAAKSGRRKLVNRGSAAPDDRAKRTIRSPASPSRCSGAHSAIRR